MKRYFKKFASKDNKPVSHVIRKPAPNIWKTIRMTDRDRSLHSYALLHRAYLHTTHPDTWRAMFADDSILKHCRQRAADALEVRDKTELQMRKQIEEGTREASDVNAIVRMAHEVAEEHLRSL